MTVQYPNAVIQIFCKAPISGQVKTRLTPDLTPKQAVQVHKELTLRTLNLVTSSNLCTVQLWCSPSVSHPFFIEMSEKFSLSLHQQSGDNLGQRMFNALQSGTKSFEHIILMGCDCPSLSHSDLAQTLNALSSEYDTILAPAEDGGYCLIASSKAVPELFDHIAWGENTVLHKTRQKIEQLSLNCLELATQWDVDHYSDYLRYLRLKTNIK